MKLFRGTKNTWQIGLLYTWQIGLFFITEGVYNKREKKKVRSTPEISQINEIIEPSLHQIKDMRSHH